MKLNAYAKVNLILNVLGTLPNGYHEVEMLMQAISLCDVVTVEFSEPADLPCDNNACKPAVRNKMMQHNTLSPRDFEYCEKDLAYRAVLLMAETFRPDLICNAVSADGLELSAGVRGVRILIEKHIPEAAGLAGGSADAAAVMIGLAKLWNIGNTTNGFAKLLNTENTTNGLAKLWNTKNTTNALAKLWNTENTTNGIAKLLNTENTTNGIAASENLFLSDNHTASETNNTTEQASLGSTDQQAISNTDQASLTQSTNKASDDSDRLLRVLLPLGAKLGSDIPFCIAAQLGHPAAIARGTGTELEFVKPIDCGVSLYFSDHTLPNKTSAVYRELRSEDCWPHYDINAFLAAKTIEEKRALMGNHLQPAAERLFERYMENSMQPATEQMLEHFRENCLHPATEQLLERSRENCTYPATNQMLEHSRENCLHPATEQMLNMHDAEYLQEDPDAEKPLQYSASNPNLRPVSGIKPDSKLFDTANTPGPEIRPIMCGAGPTYFTIGKIGEFRTIV